MDYRYSGHVYFVVGNNLVKIGATSTDVRMRLTGLQTGSPVPLSLLALQSSSNVYDLERRLHQRFRRFRVRGEWFKFEGPLRAYIRKRCDSVKNFVVVKQQRIDWSLVTDKMWRTWSSKRIAIKVGCSVGSASMKRSRLGIKSPFIIFDWSRVEQKVWRMSNKEIAKRLGCSISTVWHKRFIFDSRTKRRLYLAEKKREAVRKAWIGKRVSLTESATRDGKTFQVGSVFRVTGATYGTYSQSDVLYLDLKCGKQVLDYVFVHNVMACSPHLRSF